jgi:hypothetical protein
VKMGLIRFPETSVNNYHTTPCNYPEDHRFHQHRGVSLKSRLNWKKAIVVPIYKGGDRSVVGNYRPVSLTSVVCKQMEHVIAGYVRQVWEMSEWLYEGQHGFRPGYSCERQVVTVCQDIADSLDE